jgi:ProP effector
MSETITSQSPSELPLESPPALASAPLPELASEPSADSTSGPAAEALADSTLEATLGAKSEPNLDPSPESTTQQTSDSTSDQPLTKNSAQPTVVQPTPAECAQQLRQLFPALFGGAVKPLKLRIQVDIQERAPGKFSKQTLSAFFRRYTGSTSYLLAVSKSPNRIDLDGQPAGEVSEEHRKAASEELTRRRANQDQRRMAEQEQMQLEEQQRRNRAGLLHDFQTTTLTPANFCALKGVAVEELDGLLDIARREAEERARNPPRPPVHAGTHSQRSQQSPGGAPTGQPRRAGEFDRQRRGPPGGGQRPRNQR